MKVYRDSGADFRCPHCDRPIAVKLEPVKSLAELIVEQQHELVAERRKAEAE